MEKRGRGRPSKISPNYRAGLERLYGGNDRSARTIRDKVYLNVTMVAAYQELKLNPTPANLNEVRTQLNKRWPFSFSPVGKRMHNSLLVEIGRWEDQKSIIGMLDALERETEKLKIKDAIQMLRDIRMHNRA
jgi:hypothetical protein